jgi:regulator of replication initiation timing
MSLLQKYASLLEENEALKKENVSLKAWKESALSVYAEMDEQAIAKMLGGELGKSCRKIIAEKVPQLLKENAALQHDKRMLQWLLDNCASFVTVDNTTGEPEIYIVEATREALNAELEKDM